MSRHEVTTECHLIGDGEGHTAYMEEAADDNVAIMGKNCE